MKWVKTAAAFLVLLSATNAFALEQSVWVNPQKYGVQSFSCGNKLYFSDIPLPRIHGCESKPVSFGTSGQTAKFLHVSYDWQTDANGAAQPKDAYFMETPEQEIYRMAGMRFLHSPKVKEFFESTVGMQDVPTVPEKTNITLERFSDVNFDRFANSMCVNYYLKHPLNGMFGWCQGDTIIEGRTEYIKGALTFTRAALLVQNYVYENKIPIVGNRLFTPHTYTALNTTPQGWLYWAFAAKADPDAGDAKYYNLRVYFNGRIEVHSLIEEPKSPNEL